MTPTYSGSPAGAVTSYATLAQIVEYLRIESTDAGDDTVLTGLLEAASRLIERMTGRVFAGASATRYFDTPGGQELALDTDLVSVTTLTNGDGTVIAAGDYSLWPRNAAPKRAIVLKSSSAVGWLPDASGSTDGAISVLGVWGYCAEPPADIQQACLLIAASLYKRRFGENLSSVSTLTAGGVVITPQDIPGAAWEIIKAYRRRL